MNITPFIAFLAVFLVIGPVGNPAFAVSERRPVLPPSSANFLETGETEVYVEYEHEESATARVGSGQIAPNPGGVEVNFDTFYFSLRYGVSRRVNVVATQPVYSIASRTNQPVLYDRKNRGPGDPLVVVEYAALDGSRLVLIGGFKLPLSDTDRTDELGQPFADVLALGSGTLDVILGGRLWLRPPATKEMAVMVEARHRFRGGANKWGYQFGDETDFAAFAGYPFSESGRLGLRLEGYHIRSSLWHGIRVQDTGATMLYAGPTVSWDVHPEITLGAFSRFPVVMHLEGTQMVARARLGLTVTVDIDSVVRRVSGRDGDPVP